VKTEIEADLLEENGLFFFKTLNRRHTDFGRRIKIFGFVAHLLQGEQDEQK
jgi:hypothetical protein